MEKYFLRFFSQISRLTTVHWLIINNPTKNSNTNLILLKAVGHLSHRIGHYTNKAFIKGIEFVWIILKKYWNGMSVSEKYFDWITGLTMANKLSKLATLVGVLLNFWLNASDMLCAGSVDIISTLFRTFASWTARLQLKRGQEIETFRIS